jgi:hypothetical protein
VLVETDHPIEINIPLERVNSRDIHAFEDYWKSKCHDGAIALRSDIEPSEIKRFLPGIILVDFLFDPFDIYYRLCGTRIVEMRGELTGKRLTAVPYWTDEEKRCLLADYRVAAFKREPAYSWDRVKMKSGAAHYFYSGVWPLSSNGTTIDKAIVFEDFVGIDASNVLVPARTVR